MQRIWAILIKEFNQMKRDKAVLLMLILMPLMQLIIFGYAINTDVKHVPTVIYDQSQSEESRELINAFVGTSYYDVVEYVHSNQDMLDSIYSGKAVAALAFPPTFSEDIKHGRTAEMQLIVDASDNMTANSAISTAQLLGQQRSLKITSERMLATGLAVPSGNAIDVKISPWFNPDFLTAYNIVPGIISMMITMTLVSITAMAIVREQEVGTLEQLMVTPLKNYEIIIGKVIPYVIIGYVQAGVTLIAGVFLFDVPFQGSFFVLFITTTIFLIASLLLGILISTVAKTQLQAMQMSIMIYMPSILLSGFMFPRVAMDAIFQYIGALVPMTFYLTIIRGIMLKGIGFEYLWPQVLALCTFIVIVGLISMWSFTNKRKNG
ncbi:MAG: ABC transporter permease [Veillonella sp.]|uniref:ABC transporter permease n=1 Tax=Veillonella sp. TaxID=1926307 RepID=UPI0025CD5852|nr:ABC transporter permease [Veillonella sp.]MBS4913209.1 ABC transporter permease [Veillonella sp.]